MRVAVVCPYDLGMAGGVQQLTIELVERLGNAGHDAWLVGPGERDRARSVGPTTRIRANRSVVPVALGRGVGTRTRAALAGADVVHIHEPLIPRVSTSALGVPVPKVLTFHADAPWWASAAYRALARPMPLGRHVVTAVSSVAAAALPSRWGPVEIIPNALNVAAYVSEETRHPRRVTFLGRDDPRKGLDLLLAAWPEIRATVGDAELVVMGAARDTPIAGVRFAGRVTESEKRDLLASSAVHVAPNTGGESFGIVVAEAMAAGCAVVASDLPAFTAVMDGAGVHVPVGDVPAISRAVIELLTEEAAARRHGAAGRAKAAEYDWSVVTGRYVEAYRRAVG
ncbi:MAG: glycosyltransferase family 4 protein [Acidimicrobiia bacterium]